MEGRKGLESLHLEHANLEDLNNNNQLAEQIEKVKIIESGIGYNEWKRLIDAGLLSMMSPPGSSMRG